MTQGILSHFGIGWRTFKSYPGVFVLSMLTLFGSWVVLELGVISLQRFGIVVWVVLHLAFLVLFSGLLVGLHRMALGFLLFFVLLNLAGTAFLGVGLFIAFPVSLIATASLYRSLRTESAQ